MQPQTPVQNNFPFLQPQRNVVQPLLQEQGIISLHAFGMGSFVIRRCTSLLPPSPSIFHPFPSGFGSKGSWHEACSTRVIDNARGWYAIPVRPWSEATFQVSLSSKREELAHHSLIPCARSCTSHRWTFRHPWLCWPLVFFHLAMLQGDIYLETSSTLTIWSGWRYTTLCHNQSAHRKGRVLIVIPGEDSCLSPLCWRNCPWPLFLPSSTYLQKEYLEMHHKK